MKKKEFKDIEYAVMNRSNKLPVYVRSAGHFNLKQKDISSLHKDADFCELFWIIDGKGYFEYKNKRYICRPGDVWYYPRHSEHIFYPVESEFHYRWLSVAGEMADALFESVQMQPGLNYGGDCPEDIFTKVELNLTQGTFRKQMKLLAAAYEIICLAVSGEKNNSRTKNYVDVARQTLDNDFTDPELNIQRLSAILHVNRVQLSRDFVKRYGVTISDYLRNLRIQKGISLLTTTDLSITEIAEICGYNSVAYFSKVIIAATGQPPTVFRKNKNCLI